MARSTQLVGGTLPMKWSSSTMSTAQAPDPVKHWQASMQVKGPGLALAGTGTPDIAASPGLDAEGHGAHVLTSEPCRDREPLAAADSGVVGTTPGAT